MYIEYLNYFDIIVMLVRDSDNHYFDKFETKIYFQKTRILNFLFSNRTHFIIKKLFTSTPSGINLRLKYQSGPTWFFEFGFITLPSGFTKNKQILENLIYLRQLRPFNLINNFAKNRKNSNHLKFLNSPSVDMKLIIKILYKSSGLPKKRRHKGLIQ